MLGRLPGAEFNYFWMEDARPRGRRGQPCRIVAKGAVPGIVAVEFADGRRFYVERLGLLPRKVGP